MGRYYYRRCTIVTASFLVLLLLCFLDVIPRCVATSSPRLGALSKEQKRRRQSSNSGTSERVLNLPLRPDNGAPFDNCGVDVAISDSIIVMGCPNDATDGQAVGSAVVFEYNSDGEWIETARLRPDTPSTFALFGTRVATDGTTIVIGAIRIGAAGVAYVFERNEYTQQWTQADVLTASALGDQFGRDIAVLGNTIAVGAAFGHDTVLGAGSVYVFEKSPTVGWTQTAKLQASDASPQAFFGTAIAIAEAQLVIGAFGALDDDRGAATGAVYVFDFEPILGEWKEVTKLMPDDVSSGDAFGEDIALSGDLLVAGAAGAEGSGAVYTFANNGISWYQIEKTTTEDSCNGDCFGGAVALENNLLVVGSRQQSTARGNRGVAFVFERVGGTWQPVTKLTAAEGLSTGADVGISRGQIVVGSPGGALQGISFVSSVETLRMCEQHITGFDLVDPTRGTRVPLPGVIDLASFENEQVNIEALAEDCGRPLPVIQLGVSGVFSALERRPPFDLFSQSGSLPRDFQNVKACLCRDEGCDATSGCLDVDTFVDDSCEPEITEIIAYDAFTDQPLMPLSPGAQICIPTSGDLNFEAKTSCLKGIDFRLGGSGRSDRRDERNPPYFMYGDMGEDVFRQYGEGAFVPGRYTIQARHTPQIATPTNSPVRLRISFNLIDCTDLPSSIPSVFPSYVPSSVPSSVPSIVPSIVPSSPPSPTPSAPIQTQGPSSYPTEQPHISPSKAPTISPSSYPTEQPNIIPSKAPTKTPSSYSPVSDVPTQPPTKGTSAPSMNPTNVPSFAISTPTEEAPSSFQSGIPSELPSSAPPTSLPPGAKNLTMFSSNIPTKPPTR